MSLRLINLDCPSCGSAMRGEGLDTIFFCAYCGDAAVLDDEGLQTVDSTALLPTPGRHAHVWRPAWRFEVQVRVHQRVRADGRTTPDWEGRRIFYIPAFDLSLDDMTRLSRALSEVSETTAEVLVDVLVFHSNPVERRGQQVQSAEHRNGRVRSECDLGIGVVGCDDEGHASR